MTSSEQRKVARILAFINQASMRNGKLLIPSSKNSPSESDIEEALLSSWERLFAFQLISRQYRTGVGVIDVLGYDPKTGIYIVIEIKADVASASSFGQILAYLSVIQDTIARGNDQGVVGIIICEGISQSLKTAISFANTENVVTVTYHLVVKETVDGNCAREWLMSDKQAPDHNLAGSPSCNHGVDFHDDPRAIRFLQEQVDFWRQKAGYYEKQWYSCIERTAKRAFELQPAHDLEPHIDWRAESERLFGEAKENGKSKRYRA